MNPDILKEAANIHFEDKKITRFRIRIGVFPVAQTTELFNRSRIFFEQLNEVEAPQTRDELLESELKRHIGSRLLSLDKWLSGKSWTIEDYQAVYGISPDDLQGLKPWLEQNKQPTLQATEDLYERLKIDSYELSLPVDIPRIQTQAIGFVGNRIDSYHLNLGDLFSSLSDAGKYLRRISAEVSTTDRSYFNFFAKRLGLSLANICYEDEGGEIQLRERELIRLYGHEGMGHALKAVISQSSNLPIFLSEISESSSAAGEAVSQHFEKEVFNVIAGSPETQKKLRIADIFPEILREEIESRAINQFKNRFHHYGITVLADKSLGHHHDPEVIKKRIDILSAVSWDQTIARNFVDNSLNEYDSSGNLNEKYLREIVYASMVVDKVMLEFAKNDIHYDQLSDRSRVDIALLTGYYTPKGLLDNAKLTAQGL